MNEFVGKWRIIHMEVWSQDSVDLMVDGYFEFFTNGQGQFAFCAVEGNMDVVVNTRIPELEFSWEGTDDYDHVSGRGKIDFKTPFKGEGILWILWIHNGDSSIYTTNAIESLNSVIRKSVKTRKVFPSDDAAFKVVYLAIQAASKKWTMPIRNWKPALNRFIIEFEEQIAPHI